jgi:hypothetical protein
METRVIVVAASALILSTAALYAEPATNPDQSPASPMQDKNNPGGAAYVPANPPQNPTSGPSETSASPIEGQINPGTGPEIPSAND